MNEANSIAKRGSNRVMYLENSVISLNHVKYFSNCVIASGECEPIFAVQINDLKTKY